MNSKFDYNNYRRVNRRKQNEKLQEAALEYKLDPEALLEDCKRNASEPSDLNNLRHNSLQDKFLSSCIRDSLQVQVFLLNESIERGEIVAFDNWVILFKSKGAYSLIYKTALCLISPVKETDDIALQEEGLKYVSLSEHLRKDRFFNKLYEKQEYRTGAEGLQTDADEFNKAA